MKTAYLLLFLSILPFSTVSAQENTDDNTEERSTGNRFWEATLPSGEFMVDLSRIASISKHEYLVGPVKVTEVVIDTDGTSLARFYTSEVITQGELVNQAIQKSRQTLSNTAGAASGVDTNPVLKDYPTTTHAKTVEYNLQDVGAVDALYNSIKKAWSRNRGAKFTLK